MYICIGKKNKTYKKSVCCFQHNTTKTKIIDCNSKTPKITLRVKCNKTSHKYVTKMGVLVTFPAGNSALPSAYLLGIYYASAMLVTRDDSNDK